jgi:hypothetical protein
MDVEMTDNDGSNWTKILNVSFGGPNSLGHGIIHPQDDYELLIDRVKEVLKEKNIDSKRMKCVYDTKTKMKVTKALWALEMHTTKDVTVQLFPPFALFALFTGLTLVFPTIPIMIGINSYFETNNFLTGLILTALVLLFMYGIVLAIVYLIFKRYERRSQEAAQAILYPV